MFQTIPKMSPYLVHWNTSGTFMEHLWNISAAHFKTTPRTLMELLWNMFGPFVDHVRDQIRQECFRMPPTIREINHRRASDSPDMGSSVCWLRFPAGCPTAQTIWGKVMDQVQHFQFQMLEMSMLNACCNDSGFKIGPHSLNVNVGCMLHWY